jgi:GDP-L-fucose synthase
MMFVTGRTGLLGSEILEVNIASRGISSKDCDLKNQVMTSGYFNQHKEIKTIIHCAARVGGVKANTDFVAGFFDDNVKINMNVLDVCRDKNLKLVSVLSTCIYPDTLYVKYPLTEDQLHMGPPHESNFGYAYAKRMLEVQSRAYRQQYGCNFISVIPNNLYGVNDNYDLESGHVIPALIRKFHEAIISNQKEVVIWGSGKPLREFTFARDAAQIILWLAENYDGAQPVNIGNPEQISIQSLVLAISGEMRYKGTIRFDNSMPDGQFKKPSSNQFLKSLGWKGDYTPLRVGLKETINSFQERYPNVRGVRIKV